MLINAVSSTKNVAVNKILYNLPTYLQFILKAIDMGAHDKTPIN